MRSMLKTFKALVLMSGVLACAAVHPASAADECSNATLKGEYAFGATNLTAPQVVAGIKTFDGNGTFTQRDYRGDSLRTQGLTDFSVGETGTYSVNSDCTGTGIITIPAPGTSSGTISFVFVISDGGRHIHEVVAKLIPPGSPVAVPAQTSADDWKIGSGHKD
jgi:hypothetical protein